MAKKKPGLKVKLPKGADLQSLPEVLAEIAKRHPGIEIGNWPFRGAVGKVEDIASRIEQDLQTDVPDDLKPYITAPLYLWGYDEDLHLVIILAVNPLLGGFIPVMIESSQEGLPVGRQIMEGTDGRRRFGRRSLKLPLVDILRDLARLHPGMILSRAGMPDTPVEEMIELVELAIIDPRLLPPAHVQITGHNFFWAFDEEDRLVIMTWRPDLGIIDPTPLYRETWPKEGGSMGARRREPDPLPSGEGPWNDILGRTGEAYTDFIRALMLQRIKNSVSLLGMKGEEAMRWADCFDKTATPEKVLELLQQIVPETLEDTFISEVERLLRGWHGSAYYAARPEVLAAAKMRARNWYLYLAAASEIEEICGWVTAYTHSKTPDVILMDAVHYAGEGTPAPNVN